MHLSRRDLIALAAAPVTQAADSTEMARIPGGSFTMGLSEDEIERRFPGAGPGIRRMLLASTPGVEVRVKPFLMDRREVTNGEFQAFIDANPAWGPSRIEPRFQNGDYLKHWVNGRLPEGKSKHPVVYVSWYAAMAYAEWRGKRLPTEAEWEWAARGGPADLLYPWGNEPPAAERANYSASRIGEPVETGRYKPSAFGLFDLAGNVWEYCANPWSDHHPAPALEKDWRSVTSRRVIRGGSWGAAPAQLSAVFRDSHPPEGAGPHVGFRCVRDL